MAACQGRGAARAVPRALAHSPAGVAELAWAVGRGEQRLRRALEGLAALGLAFVEAGRPPAATTPWTRAPASQAQAAQRPAVRVEIVEGPAAIAARAAELPLRRRVTDLLSRLGATSRCRAGAQAIRRCWP